VTDHHQHVAAIHLEVTGLVQGVGFRWFVRERARVLHLSGWVRNLENGNVEVAAAGDGAALAALAAALERGPAGAEVRDVVHYPPDPDAEYPKPFSIRR
jgi:acylphosphatase